jgi:hypothetical protein
MLLGSLLEVGGRRYLVKLAQDEPGHYTKLLCMLMPKEVSHSGVITGVSVSINTNLAMGATQQNGLMMNALKDQAESLLTEASYDAS